MHEVTTPSWLGDDPLLPTTPSPTASLTSITLLHPLSNTPRWLMSGARRRVPRLLLLFVFGCLFKLAMSAPPATASPQAKPKRKWGEPAHSSSPPPPSPMLPDVDEENEKAAGEAVIQLAEALVNVESLSGREHAMAHALQGWLSKRGWEVVLQPVPPASGHEKEVRKLAVFEGLS